jgi:3-oxoacyl-[acyl-carrier protein] reductase
LRAQAYPDATASFAGNGATNDQETSGQGCPLFGRSEEVAAGLILLASTGASFVTGTVLNIDGGFGAR